MLATSSDDDQWWPKHIYATFCIPLLNLLRFMQFIIRLCIVCYYQYRQISHKNKTTQ
jgi:hypothetical protein